MSYEKVVIVDVDEARRTEVYRKLAPRLETIPVGSVREVGRTWPDNAWFLVHDDDAVLDELNALFELRGVFNPVVTYAAALHPQKIAARILSGVMNCLPWPSEAGTLVHALDGLEDMAQRRCAAAAARTDARRKLARLSPREFEVLGAMRDGLTNKEIGKALGISNRTVEIHRAKAIAKLETGQSIAAAALLIEAGDDPTILLAS